MYTGTLLLLLGVASELELGAGDIDYKLLFRDFISFSFFSTPATRQLKADDKSSRMPKTLSFSASSLGVVGVTAPLSPSARLGIFLLGSSLLFPDLHLILKKTFSETSSLALESPSFQSPALAIGISSLK